MFAVFHQAISPQVDILDATVIAREDPTIQDFITFGPVKGGVVGIEHDPIRPQSLRQASDRQGAGELPAFQNGSKE